MKACLLSEEVPVTIFVNGKNLTTLMCTPEKLKELAAGHLLNSGFVKSMDDIHLIRACDTDEREIHIQAAGVDLEGHRLKQMVTSGCGGGHLHDRLKELPLIHSSHYVHADEVRLCFKRMIKESAKYQEHGGIHASALVSDGFFITLEDVARHNSHDKVTGYAAFRGVDFTKSMIITTGRISADMVYKAVNTQVPIIGSLSIPTTLAVEIAEHCGVTVIGRAMRPAFQVFTHPERIHDKGGIVCLVD